jgi:predicted MFS family arabinose efflux permease
MKTQVEDQSQHSAVCTEADIQSAGQETVPGYSRFYRAWVLALMLLMMTSNYIDRTIVVVLAEPISREFGLSAFQIGLLGGPAFALVYVVMGILIAHLSERSNRVRIIGAAIIVWSAMTVMCGLAGSYLQLLGARMGVSIGESGAFPPAQSLVADYFPPETRASAISILLFGVGAGSILGAAIGGYAGEAWGWRAALLIVGAPGFALGLLFLLAVREPPRGHQDARGSVPVSERAPFLDTARRLFTNPVFVHLSLGAGIATFALQALVTFESTFFVRKFSVSLGLSGLLVGLTTGLSLVAGPLIGGFVSDALAQAGKRWHIWAPAIAMGLAAPVYAIAFAQSTWQWSAAILLIGGWLPFFYSAPAQATIQNMCHSRMRATAIALYVAVIGTIGLAGGPVVVGALTDAIAASRFDGGDYRMLCQRGTGALRDGEACRNAATSGLQITLMGSFTLFLWAALHLGLAARAVRRGVTMGFADGKAVRGTDGIDHDLAAR